MLRSGSKDCKLLAEGLVGGGRAHSIKQKSSIVARALLRSFLGATTFITDNWNISTKYLYKVIKCGCGSLNLV